MSLSALLIALALQSGADAPPDPDEIEALEREAEETRAEAEARAARADELAAEIAGLRERLIEAANRVRVREAAAREADARLAELEMEEDRLATQLKAERESLAQVLGALQRIETGSPPALAVTPDDAADAARAAGLLAHLAPQLETRARSVRERLDQLDVLRAELIEQGARVEEAETALAETRAEVERLISERRDRERQLRAEAEDLSRRAAQIAERARSLDELLAQIRRFAAAEPRLNPRRTEPRLAEGSDLPVPRLKPERDSEGVLLAAVPVTGEMAGFRFTDARGRLSPPVLGDLTTGYGEPGPDGRERDGVWFTTRPRAQVVAPFDGTVVFAGNFQSLEGVLVLNTADGYTLVIGGMAAIYASEGQAVLTGEPVGAMPGRENPPPRLYFGILRSTDNPVNPENWLRPEFRRG